MLDIAAHLTYTLPTNSGLGKADLEKPHMKYSGGKFTSHPSPHWLQVRYQGEAEGGSQ